jgi:hypothetical protein
MKLTLLIAFAFTVTSTTHGQYLQFDDMLKIHSLDSISLKQFCADKGHDLKKVTGTNYSVSYTFQSKKKRSSYFTRTFPRDTSRQVQLYYYLNNAKAYRELKSSARAAGFVFSKKYALPARYPDMQNEVERYIKDALELDFEISNVGPGRYVVTLVN